jgi:hypothetical protein
VGSNPTPRPAGNHPSPWNSREANCAARGAPGRPPATGSRRPRREHLGPRTPHTGRVRGIRWKGRTLEASEVRCPNGASRLRHPQQAPAATGCSQVQLLAGPPLQAFDPLRLGQSPHSSERFCFPPAEALPPAPLGGWESQRGGLSASRRAFPGRAWGRFRAEARCCGVRFQRSRSPGSVGPRPARSRLLSLALALDLARGARLLARQGGRQAAPSR